MQCRYPKETARLVKTFGGARTSSESTQAMRNAVCELIDFEGGDVEAASLWLETPLPQWGGTQPAELIADGRDFQLHALVRMHALGHCEFSDFGGS